MDVQFRCRINCVDHYQAIPVPDFDPPLPRPAQNEKVDNYRHKISVLRVFGATETGQKVLMHVHGALQYTYVEYSGSLKSEDVDIAARTLQLSIDHALAVSYRQNVYDSKNKYVAHVSLVKGVPFYGFHVGYKFYFKIYLLNPLHMTRLSDLLREGAVMKRVLQPYESHMQYIAQWMCDYNLYGCAYVECAKVKFRSPVPGYLELDSSLHPWHDRSIPAQMISDEASVPKQSHCALEVDVCVEDIVNRKNVYSRPLHHDFIERIKPLPIDQKLVQSMAGLWKDETRRRKARMGLKDPKSSPFPPEVLISMSANPRNTNPGGWIHEEEFRQNIAAIAAQEHEDAGRTKLDFEIFVQPTILEKNVQTALESVTDLYRERIRQMLAQEEARLSATDSMSFRSSQALVDENLVHGVAKSNTSGPSGLTESIRATTNRSSSTAGPPFTSSGESSDSNVKTPISSGEYATLGIGKHEDLSDLEVDDFEIPQQYLAAKTNWKPSNKRGKPESLTTTGKSPKKARFLEENSLDNCKDIRPTSFEEEDGLDGVNDAYREQALEALDHDLEVCEGAIHPKSDDIDHKIKLPASQPKSSSQNSVIKFPVVKDPNDPNTLARLSQQSSQSQKLSPSKVVKPSPAPLKPSLESMRSKLRGQPDSFRSISRSSLGKTQALVFKSLVPPKGGCSLQIFTDLPPSAKHVKNSMRNKSLPDVIYQEAYYDKEEDVPDRQREYAGREFKLESLTLPYLPDFDPHGTSAATFGQKPQILLDRSVEDVADRQRRQRCTYKSWSIAAPPPTRIEVEAWIEVQNKKYESRKSRQSHLEQAKKLSQIEDTSQKNKFGFKYSSKQDSTSVQHETQYMSLMSLEIHVNTRGNLAPNPEEDEVACIFWCVQTDDEQIEINTKNAGMHAGILVLSEGRSTATSVAEKLGIEVEEEKTELELLMRVVDIMRFYDPDILTGYEVHNSSWGYLIERARVKYDLNYCDELSRMKALSHGRFGRDEDRWGFNHTSTIRVTGRHTINIWRAMRGELNLLQYTMENVVFHLLHRRIPHYSFADLTRWYKSKKPAHIAKVIEYLASRVQIDLEILEANELVPRTSEQARLIGVDWFSVISRGSQFKVENIMFRIAKPEDLILVSPSRRQVGGQNALECLPLVMEPQSDFYSSPMLVLDFQSLYPSCMIAYNYCYSTFLGRIVGWRGTNKMGFTNYQRQQRLIELLKDHINIAPNGIMYAKSQIRKSLLAKMLSEILETRVMVKSGMKVDKDDKTLQQLLNNRQLALKLIANVTYGYTSASFSGRMPCSEIADSIVQTGRETLEKAIALIHSVDRWGAEVVYGDTDSLFVYLKGRTREQAFDIGEDIAKHITEMNPRPIKLKFEKVYHPCVLLAKKRYVGFKYESRSQAVPEFEAKGIETVRRDGTPAEQKIEENALKVLFRTADLSSVKAFFQAQCSKIMRGKVSIQDFCFAKEVRLGTYSDKGPPPPGALISARRMLEDPRQEPQYGERVPYVVVTGGPGARLIDRCVAPEVLLNDAQQELDAEYYISKNIIPPLERIFNLVGANVRQWYDEMPKYQRIRRVEGVVHPDNTESVLSKKTLESYMKSSACIVCREPLDSEMPLCYGCLVHASQSLLHLQAKLTKAERKKAQQESICRSCSGVAWADEVRCDSKDCPVFYSRTRYKAALSSLHAHSAPVIKVLEEQINDEIEW